MCISCLKIISLSRNNFESKVGKHQTRQGLVGSFSMNGEVLVPGRDLDGHVDITGTEIKGPSPSAIIIIIIIIIAVVYVIYSAWGACFHHRPRLKYANTANLECVAPKAQSPLIGWSNDPDIFLAKIFGFRDQCKMIVNIA